MTDVQASPQLKPYMHAPRAEVIRVFITGLIAGGLVPLLGLAIANGIIASVFCNAGQDFSVCSSGGVVAYHIAAIIVGMVVVAIFASWGVFRPLPLILAATIAMWGFKKFVDPLSGHVVEYFAFSMALTAFLYLLFYWLLRLRHFPLSIVLTASATALVCWSLVA